jgi:hypothetical protein
MSHQTAAYPDMNVIFKGIPKMMQVADDMHRMTNCIQDLRNMTLGLSAITVLGIAVFLLLKCVKKQNRRRRRFIHNIDSEQSSLSRNGGTGHYRHFPRHNGDWAHKIVDMQSEPPTGNSGHTTATGATANTISRHTPPIHNRYGISHTSAITPNPLPAQSVHGPQIHVLQRGNGQGTPDQSGPDYQTSSQHSAISTGGLFNGNNGSGSALGMKRLDPVKLTVDEVPYADNI